MNKQNTANQKRDQRWLKKQKEASKFLQNSPIRKRSVKYSEVILIEKILENGVVSMWERNFLNNIKGLRSLSNKQNDVLGRIKDNNTSIL